MLHAGLDLSRKKVDVCLRSDAGEHLDQLAVPPDADSLRTLARRIEEVHREPVCAVVESMTGARLLHDTLEQQGWSVEIAAAHRVKAMAPLACKTDRIDSLVLATLSHRDPVPAIWLPHPEVRSERELARFRLHLVKHRSALKEPDPLDPDQLRPPPPGHRPVRGRGPKALGEARRPRALAGQRRRGAGADRRPRAPDRSGQPPPASRPRRSPLRPADVGAGDRLDARLYDRGRDRRHRALCSPQKLTGYTGVCPRTGPPTCAGHCWRRRCTR
jgi:Transposase